MWYNEPMSIRLKVTNTCEVCGGAFHPYAKEQRTCSVECFNKIRSQSRRKRAEHTCEVCGKTFEYKAYRSPRFCSKECWSNRRKPFMKTCEICGRQFDAKDHRAVVCSRQCLIDYKT